MLKPPLISVVMPAYNSSAYIREAIDSILNQSEQNFELIIVNDGSSDNTESIVQSFASDKIRYYANSKNIGISGTYNKAFEIARGEYIAIAEHDDISHPRRLEIQANFLASHPQIGVVSTRMKVFEGQPPTLDSLQIGAVKIKYNPKQIRGKLVFGGVAVPNPPAMIRKSALVQHRIAYDINLHMAMDLDLFQRLGLVSDMVLLDLELLLYRMHPNNHSKNIQDGRLYTHKVKTAFWKNNFNVDFSDVLDEFFRVKDINQFVKLNAGVEKIVREKIYDPRFDVKMLRTGAASFLYRRLRDLESRTKNYGAIYAAFRQSEFLHGISINRKLRFHLKALFSYFLVP